MLRLSAAGIPCGYPISFETLQHHAQAIENQYLREVETSGWGKVWTGGAPWELSRTPVALVRRLSAGRAHRRDPR